MRGESAEMRRSGEERCATVQLWAFSFRLSERISIQIACCRGMKAQAMTQFSKADTAFEQSVLRCTLNSSLLTVIPYFGVHRVVHEHCCSCPERTKLGQQQFLEEKNLATFFDEDRALRYLPDRFCSQLSSPIVQIRALRVTSVLELGLVGTSQRCSRPGTRRALTRDLGRV